LNLDPNGPCSLQQKIAYKKKKNRLVLYKKTPTANNVKTLMHITTKQIQKIPKL
jgi:hypothetical protein